MVFKIFLAFFLTFFLPFYLINSKPEKKVDFDTKDYYHFHFSKDVDLEDFSRESGFEHHEELEHLNDNHHIFSIDKGVSNHEIHKRIENYFGLGIGNALDGFNSDKLFYYEKQKLSVREKKGIIRDPSYFDDYQSLPDKQGDQPVDPAKSPTQDLESIKKILGIEDPLFDKQWYLFNTKKPGADINVTGLWLEGVTGKGVTVAVPDDGLYFNNLDLKPNYCAECSYDFITESSDPSPKQEDDTHGTRCAGEIAASKNTLCGLGVAYESKISGIRFFGSRNTPWLEGKALFYKPDINDIYSCSWGPPDNGIVVEDIPSSTYTAIIKGINEGRNGLGSIYVFGSGNGGYFDDCNYSGYANSPYTITIAAMAVDEIKFVFSEPCPCILASTYSGKFGSLIYTTDVGEKECSSRHTGTSASTPIAAGILALVLSVRPNLTWRDVQSLIVTTAVPFNLGYEGWETLPSGRKYHNYFGYGKLDAYAMVQAAKNFKHLNPQVRFSTPLVYLNKKFSENNGHITSKINIHEGYLSHYGFGNLEYVGLSLYYTHQKRGSLEINITSPNGVTSTLAHRRARDRVADSLYWTFTTVKHWGESIIGDWTIDVEDKKDSAFDGEIFDWQLHFFGESNDPTKSHSIVYPFITRHPATIPSPTASVSSATVPSESAPSKPLPKPEGQPKPPEPEPGPMPTRPSVPQPTSEPKPAPQPAPSSPPQSEPPKSGPQSASKSASSSSTAVITSSSTSSASSTPLTTALTTALKFSTSTSTSSSTKTKAKTATQKASPTSSSTLSSSTQGSSHISFFKKYALFIYIFTAFITLLIFVLLFLLIRFFKKRNSYTNGLLQGETFADEFHPNTSQQTERATMLNKNSQITSFDASDNDDTDIYERRIHT